MVLNLFPMDGYSEKNDKPGSLKRNGSLEEHKSLISSILNNELEFTVHSNQITSGLSENLLKEALNELLTENRRYSELFFSAPAGYVVLKGDFQIQEINKIAVLWLKKGEHELTGYNFSDFLDADYQDTFRFFIKNLKAGKSDGCKLKLKDESQLFAFRGTSGLENEIENQTYRILFFGLSKGTISNTNSQLETDVEYAPDQKPKSGNGILKDLTILVADDDELARIYIDQLLNDKCRKVLFAENGKEAVEIFQNNMEIDLILMDIKMPVLDGYSATIKIKEQNKKVIVIAQTAYALASDREKALAAGCDDYLAKPLMKKDLFTVIEKFFK